MCSLALDNAQVTKLCDSIEESKYLIIYRN